MAHTHTSVRPHTECRHRLPIPLPAVEDVEPRRLDVRSPALLALRQLERRDPRQPPRRIRLRQRRLTRPVIVAIMGRVVWRRVPSIAAGQKVLAREGLLGMAPLQVRPQAITERLDVLPAAVLGQLLAAVCARLHAEVPPARLLPGWAPARKRCSWLALVDGATLEARRNTTQVLREREGRVLGGKMMVMVEAFSHRPVWQLSTADAAANDQRCATESMAALPVGGLLVVALGGFSFWWFDALTPQQQFFVTRMRDKTAYRPGAVLRQGAYHRDEMVQVGLYRSHPCTPPLRLVSVWWQGTWYRDLTHVLDPPPLSARHASNFSWSQPSKAHEPLRRERDWPAWPSGMPSRRI